MRIRSILASTAFAAALIVGSPAYASGPDIEVGDVASDNSYSDDDFNGSTFVVAEQELTAININKELDEVVDLDGEDDSDTAVGYNSGNNSVNDNAFAAYAGILNQAWNTGINANTQAATNIAAQGTVNFGTNGGGGGGDGGGD